MTDPRAIIAELTRAKCAVQLRTIQMVMGLPANDTPSVALRDANHGAVGEVPSLSSSAAIIKETP